MLFKKLATCLLLAAGIAFGFYEFGYSETLFYDDFEDDATDSVLNFISLQNWDVSDGTIDYIKEPDYGITCLGDGCLDMDGSTGNAGRITSKQQFSMLPYVDYYISAQVSGNQRRNESDGITLGFWNLDENKDLGYFTISGIAFDSPFSTASYGLMFSKSYNIKLYIEGIGGDNVGVILDNVSFSNNVIPEPTSLILLGTGLGVLGLAAYRRKRK